MKYTKLLFVFISILICSIELNAQCEECEDDNAILIEVNSALKEIIVEINKHTECLSIRNLDLRNANKDDINRIKPELLANINKTETKKNHLKQLLYDKVYVFIENDSNFCVKNNITHTRIEINDKLNSCNNSEREIIFDVINKYIIELQYSVSKYRYYNNELLTAFKLDSTTVRNNIGKKEGQIDEYIVSIYIQEIVEDFIRRQTILLDSTLRTTTRSNYNFLNDKNKFNLYGINKGPTLADSCGDINEVTRKIVNNVNSFAISTKKIVDQYDNNIYNNVGLGNNNKLEHIELNPEKYLGEVDTKITELKNELFDNTFKIYGYNNPKGANLFKRKKNRIQYCIDFTQYSTDLNTSRPFPLSQMKKIDSLQFDFYLGNFDTQQATLYCSIISGNNRPLNKTDVERIGIYPTLQNARKKIAEGEQFTYTNGHCYGSNFKVFFSSKFIENQKNLEEGFLSFIFYDDINNPEILYIFNMKLE